MPGLMDGSCRLDAPRRAMLFVPAHHDRYVRSAAASDADGVVLDLEDSVPESEKETARAALGPAVVALGRLPRILARVNRSALAADLQACRTAGIAEVLLPKVDSVEDLVELDRVCQVLDYDPDISVLVESARGLRRIDEILARPGVCSVALGVEDLRAELELRAPYPGGTSATVLAALAEVVVAAVANDVVPLGIPGSIAELDDLDSFAANAAQAWSMGFRGSYCIHPRQVEILLRAYSPDDADRQWATAVVAAETEALGAGRGAFVVDGAMVDAPLINRARRILSYPSNGVVSGAAPLPARRPSPISSSDERNLS
ncbi:HpcH/HpaI aldolase/citrate lyase family protein [Nocardia sp. NPDC004278]